MTHGKKANDSAKSPGKPRTGRTRAKARSKAAAAIAFTVVAIAILVGPLTASGIWDPVELRVADLASRVAASLFHAQGIPSASGAVPTLGELGRGELQFTSIALSFRMFGLRDWSGRLPLALWVVAALVSQVAWVSRFINTRAAVLSALVFCTMPLVFFQARMMLGDAATIGTSTLSFVLLSLACLPARDREPLSAPARITCMMLGLGFSGLGVLARGLAIGVAVPTLAVSLAYVATRWPLKSHKRLDAAIAALIGVIGVAAAVVAIVIASRPAPERGILLVMQGTARAAPTKMPTFESVVTQLGHGLFPWSAVLPFGLAAAIGRLCRRGASREAAAISAVVLFVALDGAMQTWLTSIGATFPLAALAGFSIVIGTWLDAPYMVGPRWRTVILGALALMVILLADFDNLPDKLLSASTASDAKLPASFKSENQLWLRGCAAVFGGSFLLTLVGASGSSDERSFKELLRSGLRYFREAWGGQLFFFGLLIETSLITGALLVTATRLGAPFQRILYMSSSQRELLTWAWTALPAIALVGIAVAAAYRVLVHVYAPGLGMLRWGAEAGIRGQIAKRVLDKYPRLRTLQLERAAVLRIGLVLGAALLSLGWAGRLSQQLSPRRALNRYHALARPGEPLGLLGVRPQILQYYSSQRPELLLDADEAADWVLHSHAKQRRWLLVKGDQFARFNASFREKCQCARNAIVVDGRSSEMLLVSNDAVPSTVDENPLRSVVLAHRPEPRQKITGNFGDQIEAVGWDLVSEDGRAVSELRPGRNYELQLYFHVLARPTLDWEIFIHIDGYGRRFNGDHDATNGLYPVSNWRPGDYIVDRATIDLDPSFTDGNYDLYFGFFKGSRRLDVKRGNNDDNRLLAGKIRVM